jgi:transposase
LLAATLDGVVSARPGATCRAPQHLCADAGYKGSSAQKAAEARGYRPQIKQRREEVELTTGNRARRWVVERARSRLNRFRKLLVSFEKTEDAYVALLTLVPAMICWHQTIAIYG